MSALHPAVTDTEVRAMLAAAPAPPVGETDEARLSRLRANPAWRRLPDDEAVTSEDVVLAGIRVRRYEPRDAGGTLVFAHGGGWVAGGLDTNDGLCRALAAAIGCRLVSVDYRLAPEHPFPAAVDDLTRVLEAVTTGTDVVGVAGHSAGGNLAAAVALRSRDGRAPGIRAQILLCPVLDAPSANASYRLADRDLPLTAADMHWYWTRYVADATRRGDPDAAPLRAPDLSGSAPAVVVAAEVDPLRDEAIAYAARLAGAGVAVVAHLQPGVPHLYLTFPPTRARTETLDVVGPAVRAMFA